VAIDFGRAVSQGLGIRQQFDQQQQARQMQDLRGQLDFDQPLQQQSAFQQIAAINPQSASMLRETLRTDEQGFDAAFQDAAVFKNIFQRNPQQGIQFLQNRIQTGAQQGRDMFLTQSLLDTALNNPQEAINDVDEFLSIPQSLAGQKSKASKTAEQIEREIRVDEGSLALRRDELRQRQIESGKIKLSSKAEKAIIDSQDAFFKSGESARKMELLADDFNRARKRFNAIRSSQATSNLPPGPASDKDIALALSGFPKENANASQVMGFLKGQAKLARIDEKFNEFKAGFISNNNSVRGLIPAWKNQLGQEGFLDSILSPKDEIKEIQQPVNVGRFQIEVQ
jgi:hypothetical protein